MSIIHPLEGNATLREYVDNICRREQARYGFPGIPLGNGTEQRDYQRSGLLAYLYICDLIYTNSPSTWTPRWY